jgi:hypothetical protein
MIRLPTLFWLIVVATAGFLMFAVKYEVQALADELARVVKQADETERDIRILDAEWAYLNRPDALAQMNQQFLSLVPIATKQLRSGIADIPMRPVPPPPPAPAAAPETVVAQAPAAVEAAPASKAATPTLSPSAPPAAPQTPPVQPHPSPARLAENQVSGVGVPLDTPPAAHAAKAAPAARPSGRPVSAHRPTSLNELIAQIAESR